MPTVLVADDDADIRGGLRDYLRNAGFRVEEAGSGPDAVEAVRIHRPDVVVMDVMMPGFDGMEACRLIRGFSRVPIVFLTARGDEVDQLLGFGFGADDYVVKPFSPRTMVARVKALLSRGGSHDGQGDGIMAFDGLRLDPDAYSATLDGVDLGLTAKEFQLLAYLARRSGKVLTKRQLVTGAWGEEYFGDDSALMVHLSHLRQKLSDDPAKPRWIRTIRGVGYKFVPGPGV